MLFVTILTLFLTQQPDTLCCSHPHHSECIVNTDSMSSPGDCQHPHHLTCNGWISTLTIEEVLDQIEEVSIAPTKTDVVYIKIDPILKREEIQKCIIAMMDQLATEPEELYACKAISCFLEFLSVYQIGESRLCECRMLLGNGKIILH